MNRFACAALAGAACFAIPAATGAQGTDLPPATASGAEALPQLVRLSEEGNAALMQGDLATYYARIPHSGDFVLMNPFGGAPRRGTDGSAEAIAATARFFQNGTFAQEVVQTVVSDDMVMLATIERVNAQVGGLPAQDWALRLTLVYRREADGWRLVHRHADPLAHPITLQQAAALGRGAAAN
ncbi:MAG: nuclear transport factor 2 family protein [Alphaproteobacteria bacterium]